MAYIRVTGTGTIGLNRDLSQHELPIQAWTDAQNVRFLDGYANQFLGHGEVYQSPTYEPQHVLPVAVNGGRYWIYATPSKLFAVTNSGGVSTHTDISHTTPRNGVVNAWTSTHLSGIPVLNAGDDLSVPIAWNLDLGSPFSDLSNWPAGTYCRSIRSFKNVLIALNITEGTNRFPYMVWWSHPADPGALPSSWDYADATRRAGRVDIAQGADPIVDGMQLRDSFMIYKENSCWRMDFVGGNDVFRFSKVLGVSGSMNRNCIADIDGFHIVLTNNDIIIHDGNSTVSVLDKITRRWLFQNIDVDATDKCFVFKNPFFNEVFVCYPGIGSTVCDKAIVYNYLDKVVSQRDMPNVNHAAFGPVDSGLGGSWAADDAPWSSDLTVWDGPDFVPSAARVIMGTADTRLYLMDSSSAFAGAIPAAYIERRGLSFGEPEAMKLIRGIRPRITGSVGDTVLVTVGRQDDPWQAPQWGPQMTHVIGSQIANDCFVTGRYIAIKFETGTGFSWRLDSYDIDVVGGGMW